MDYMDLVIPEHRTRPKFAAWVKSALDPVRSVQDLLNALPIQYDIDRAVGIQLDRIGDILGRPRRLPFQPSEGVSPIMDDNNYRLVLKATIISEHFDGTIPNLYNLFQTVLGDTGLYFIIIDNQDMTVSIIIFGRTTSLIKDELEKGLIVPRPEGVGTTINVTSNQIFSWGFDTRSLSGGVLPNPGETTVPIDTPLEFDADPHTLVLAFSVSGNTVETGSGDKAPDNPYTLTGTTALTVSDGGNQSQTIALPQTLYSLPDGTRDEYDVVGGAGTQRVGKVVLDGSQEIVYYLYQSPYVFFTPAIANKGVSDSPNALCDKFVRSEGEENFYGMDRGGNPYFRKVLASRFGITGEETAAQAKTIIQTWLHSNPVTVLYQLATPATITGTPQPVSIYQHNVVTSDGGGRIAGIRLGNDVFSGWGTGYWLPIRSV